MSSYGGNERKSLIFTSILSCLTTKNAYNKKFLSQALEAKVDELREDLSEMKMRLGRAVANAPDVVKYRLVVKERDSIIQEKEVKYFQDNEFIPSKIDVNLNIGIFISFIVRNTKTLVLPPS